MVELYHRTTKAAARRIVIEGFRDGSGVHPALGPWTGVWLSDHALALPADHVMRYETVADHPADRAFLLPAAILNRHGRIRRIDPVRPRTNGLTSLCRGGHERKRRPRRVWPTLAMTGAGAERHA